MYDPLTDLAKLPGYDQIRHLVAGLDDDQFTHIASLQYRAACMDEYGDEWPELDLVLEHVPGPPVRIGVRLHRIHRLRVRNIHRIGRLSLYDITHRGWEGLRYRVMDEDEKHFRVYCHSLSVFNPNLSMR